MPTQFTEYTQKISYADIINRQLDRIATLRTHIHKYGERDVPGDPYFLLAREYISAVETLMVILLPELRGNADKYVLMAKQYLSLIKKKAELEQELEDRKRAHSMVAYIMSAGSTTKKHTTNNKVIDEEDPELVKEINKTKSKIEELVKQLPEKYRMFLQEYTDYLGLYVFYFLDAALEEMLVRLNQAGLLIQGRSVRVGVPSVPSRSNKESL